MKNYIQPGNVCTFTAPTGGVVSGTVYLVGAVLAVATATVAQTLPFEGLIVGTISYAKAASQAWTEGAKVYWDDTAKNFTTTAGGNTLAGFAMQAVAGGAGDVVGRIRLNGTV